MLYLLDDLIAMYPSTAISSEGLFREDVRIFVEINSKTGDYIGIKLIQDNKEFLAESKEEKKSLNYVDRLVRQIYQQLRTIHDLRDLSIPHKHTDYFD